MRGAWCAMAGAALAALAACGDGASSDPGYEAALQVKNAQYRPGEFPAPTGGPDVIGPPTTTHTAIVIGNFTQTIDGLVGATAHGVVVGAVGDDGSWIITAGPPSFENGEEEGTVSARFGFNDHAVPGPTTVQMAAVDGAGHIGSAQSVQLVVDPLPLPPDEGSAALIVGLQWENAADLDLHVVDPNGGEAWNGHPNTIDYPTDPLTCNCVPQQVGQQNLWDGGILDRDDNQDCKFADVAPAEHVVWKAMPPTGTYTVRVDAHSLCGQPDAVWYVEVLDAQKNLIAAVRGLTTPDQVTYSSHGAGAGQTALTFTR